MLYIGKIVELLKIEREEEKTTLSLRVNLEEEVNLRWEIDHFTAEQLIKNDFNFEEYKYRLSFTCNWDSMRDCYIASCTETLLEKSKKLSFLCTEEFFSNLESLKNLTSIEEVDKLPANFSNLNKKEEEKVVKVETTIPKKKPTPSLLIAVISIFVVIAMFFGYSNKKYEEPAYAEKTVDTKISTNTIYQSEQNIGDSESIKNSDARSESDDNAENSQPTIPTITVDQATSYKVPDGSVALTFDDGPSKYTKQIADILTKYNAGGTFFFIGQNVKKKPELVQYVDQKGFTIGNHSMNHPDFSKLSYEQQKLEILETNSLIQHITSKPVTLFRPPYEEKKQSTVDLLTDIDMKMVLWNKDTKDWDTDSTSKVYNYVVNSSPSGSIIIFHEAEVTVNALPKIIEYLQSKNLQIVNLSN